MATTTDDKPGTNGHASNGSRGKRRSSLMQAAVFELRSLTKISGPILPSSQFTNERR